MKLQINNFEYELYFVDWDDEHLKIDDNDYRSGMTYFKEKEIYIANNLKNDSYKYTLMHELTHAIIDSYGFLQVEWNDEIVADFMAIYKNILNELIEKVIDEKTKENK